MTDNRILIKSDKPASTAAVSEIVKIKNELEQERIKLETETNEKWNEMQKAATSKMDELAKKIIAEHGIIFDEVKNVAFELKDFVEHGIAFFSFEKK